MYNNSANIKDRVLFLLVSGAQLKNVCNNILACLNNWQPLQSKFSNEKRKIVQVIAKFSTTSDQNRLVSFIKSVHLDNTALNDKKSYWNCLRTLIQQYKQSGNLRIVALVPTSAGRLQQEQFKYLDEIFKNLVTNYLLLIPEFKGKIDDEDDRMLRKECSVQPYSIIPCSDNILQELTSEEKTEYSQIVQKLAEMPAS
jgi:hypothetical protein